MNLQEAILSLNEAQGNDIKEIMMVIQKASDYLMKDGSKDAKKHAKGLKKTIADLKVFI